MFFSAVLHRRVLTAGYPSALGRVTDLIIDPQTTRIIALCLADDPPCRVVNWADVVAFTPYGVMVRNRWCAVPAEARAAELLETGHTFLGKPLLTAAGHQIGRLTDVEFDAHTGEVTRLISPEGPVRGELLLATGSYAVVRSM